MRYFYPFARNVYHVTNANCATLVRSPESTASSIHSRSPNFPRNPSSLTSVTASHLHHLTALHPHPNFSHTTAPNAQASAGHTDSPGTASIPAPGRLSDVDSLLRDLDHPTPRHGSTFPDRPNGCSRRPAAPLENTSERARKSASAQVPRANRWSKCLHAAISSNIPMQAYNTAFLSAVQSRIAGNKHL